MTVEEACAYHALQAPAFAAARGRPHHRHHHDPPGRSDRRRPRRPRRRMPVVISFTVETDGTLPSGDRLGDAITAVDEATGGYPAYYMINCAHPTHFAATLDPGAPWTARIGGIRQRLDDEPRRAGRRHRARRRRPGRPGRALPSAARPPPAPAGARWLLRHQPPSHRRHRRPARRECGHDADRTLRSFHDGLVLAYDVGGTKTATRSSSSTASRPTAPAGPPSSSAPPPVGAAMPSTSGATDDPTAPPAGTASTTTSTTPTACCG